MRGYALGGRDPVAYFTQHKAVEGSERHELSWGGTRWIFRNEGNRAAFEKAPLVYAPAFTGCDPFALADGFVVSGNPALFALYRNRLLLFHSDINRFLFLADPQNLWDMALGNASRLGCEP
uniref:YHS domain-containing (seleno)protein n=1 Tax=Stappia sp. TaxID=1870903 RepID=UPI003BA955EC|tara:strand:+ start:931 stop:1293 length:363 start_codon:yes stop_codon:yes gene_type:complete